MNVAIECGGCRSIGEVDLSVLASAKEAICSVCGSTDLDITDDHDLITLASWPIDMPLGEIGNTPVVKEFGKCSSCFVVFEFHALGPAAAVPECPACGSKATTVAGSSMPLRAATKKTGLRFVKYEVSNITAAETIAGIIAKEIGAMDGSEGLLVTLNEFEYRVWYDAREAMGDNGAPVRGDVTGDYEAVRLDPGQGDDPLHGKNIARVHVSPHGTSGYGNSSAKSYAAMEVARAIAFNAAQASSFRTAKTAAVANGFYVCDRDNIISWLEAKGFLKKEGADQRACPECGGSIEWFGREEFSGGYGRWVHVDPGSTCTFAVENLPPPPGEISSGYPLEARMWTGSRRVQAVTKPQSGERVKTGDGEYHLIKQVHYLTDPEGDDWLVVDDHGIEMVVGPTGDGEWRRTSAGSKTAEVTDYDIPPSSGEEGFIAWARDTWAKLRAGGGAIPDWFPKSLLTPAEVTSGQWETNSTTEDWSHVFGTKQGQVINAKVAEVAEGVISTNPGMEPRQAFLLAAETVRRYPRMAAKK